jgi:hypothetical protein
MFGNEKFTISLEDVNPERIAGIQAIASEVLAAAGIEVVPPQTPFDVLAERPELDATGDVKARIMAALVGLDDSEGMSQ